MPQCSRLPPAEVPSPRRLNTEGRNRSAEPRISGVVLFPRSARTYIPQRIYVPPRAHDCSEDNTSFPKILPWRTGPGKYCLRAPAVRKCVEGFLQSRSRRTGFDSWLSSAISLKITPRTKLCSSHTPRVSCNLLLCALMPWTESSHV
jgi:hypothetical protein